MEWRKLRQIIQQARGQSKAHNGLSWSFSYSALYEGIETDLQFVK